MKPIKVVENVIEIPFEKDGKVVETLYFDKSDEAMEKLITESTEVTKVSSSEMNESDKIKETQRALKNAYDSIFGDGSYDKIYKLNPSVAIMTTYLVNIVNGIFAEMMDGMTTRTIGSYLKSGAEGASDTPTIK